jgi:hypothetical protein
MAAIVGAENLGSVIVVKDQVPIQLGEKIIARARQGEELKVEEIKGDWYCVLPTRGWIHVSFLQFQAPKPAEQLQRKSDVPPTETSKQTPPSEPAATDANAEPSLPVDFRLRWLIAVTNEIDLMDALPRNTARGGNCGLTIEARGGETTLFCGEDAAAGLDGKGLRIRQQMVGDILRGNSSFKFLWTPEPIAFYRANKLIGIWEPTAKRLNKASPNQAPTTLNKRPQMNIMVR